MNRIPLRAIAVAAATTLALGVGVSQAQAAPDEPKVNQKSCTAVGGVFTSTKTTKSCEYYQLAQGSWVSNYDLPVTYGPDGQPWYDTPVDGQPWSYYHAPVRLTETLSLHRIDSKTGDNITRQWGYQIHEVVSVDEVAPLSCVRYDYTAWPYSNDDAVPVTLPLSDCEHIQVAPGPDGAINIFDPGVRAPLYPRSNDWPQWFGVPYEGNLAP